MIGFMIALAIVAYIAVFIIIMHFSLHYRWHGGLALIVSGAWLVLGIGLLLNLIEAENARGPCVEYQTQMHYNAATKSMMPARVCVLRGEWVK